MSFHFGMDFGHDPDGTLYLGPKQYINCMMDAYQKMFGELPLKKRSPLLHNDYLELILGLGLPAAGLFLISLLMLSFRALRGYFARRRDSIYCSVAVSVSMIALLHSLLDFSIQIQAIAMSYSMLLALGIAQSRSSRRTNRD